MKSPTARTGINVLLQSCLLASLSMGISAAKAEAPAVVPESTEQAKLLPGFDRIKVSADHRASPLDAGIWYPSGGSSYQGKVGDNAVFVGMPVLQGPAVATGPHPLLVISHGSGGSYQTLSWLANELVYAGYMVLGVNHPGSTTGDSSPRRAIQHWNRPKDISASISALLADPTFGAQVDTQQISMLGFSLGGLSALSIAGARVSKEQYQQYCSRFGNKATDCQFFARGGVDLNSVSKEEFEADLADSRITRTIAVDPALGSAMLDESLKKIEQPVLLLNLGLEQGRQVAVDIGPKGNQLTSRLASAEYQELVGANHFSFLGLCKQGAEQILIDEGEDPICYEENGRDRRQLHKDIASLIVQFLNRT